MGFYTKGNYLYLPNKRVVDDLIERDGAPTKESFTPYNGMNYLIAEQMVGSRYSVLGIDVIKENITELSLTLLKGKEDSSVDEGSQGLQSDNYETILENIDESYLVKFLRNQLIKLKKQKTDARFVIKENEKVQPLMYDTESGEVFNLSDIYVQDEYEENNLLLSGIKKKIPYLLKKIQDGSIKYGVSLLSLFIARDAVMNRGSGKKDFDIKPRDILGYPIYRVSSTGELLDTFDPDTANNIQKFREPKDLILGVNPNDIYYKAGVELTTCARQLGYDLYKEDVKDYSPSYINRLMCSYIVSNQEVLSDMSAYDPNIMKLFKDGSIFKAESFSKDNNIEANTNNILRLREMAREKLGVVRELHALAESDDNIEKVREPIKLINRFLKLYKTVNKKSSMEVESTYDCILDEDTLCDSSGQPLIFKADPFLMGFGDTPLFSSTYVILTNRGYAVKIDNDPSTMLITTVTSMIMYNETKGAVNNFYKRIVYL